MASSSGGGAAWRHENAFKPKQRIQQFNSSSSKQQRLAAKPAPMSNVAQTKAAALSNQEVWTSVEDLFWDHMCEVQNKWQTLKLNDDIWAKLIYFEQNRRLAKAYVSTPILTIDGSTSGLDGFRIGLSGIENSYRNLDSIASLRSIGLGVKLKLDHEGNILIRRQSSSSSTTQGVSAVPHQAAPSQQQQQQQQQLGSIWVREWPSSSLSLTKSSDQNSCWTTLEISDSLGSHKLFDMQKFRAQLELQASGGSQSSSSPSTQIDWRQCVTIISFSRSPVELSLDKRSSSRAPARTQLLAEPCWLMLINIIAIDMLKSALLYESGSSSSSLTRRQVLTSVRMQDDTKLVRRRGKSPSTSVNGQNTGLSQHTVSVSQKQTGLSPLGNQRNKQQFYLNLDISSDTKQQQRQYKSNQHLSSAGGEHAEHPDGVRIAAAAAAINRHAFSSSSSSSSNAIYTTFTGKYLDKHQAAAAAATTTKRTKLIARNKSPLKNLSSDQLNCSSSNYYLDSASNHLLPMRKQQRSSILNNSTSLLYPINSIMPGSGLADSGRKKLVQLSGARWTPTVTPQLPPPSSLAGYDRLRAAGQPSRWPLAAATGANLTRNTHQQQHSVSALDLSRSKHSSPSLTHLVANHRSSSIKMNFDDDDDDDDDDDNENDFEGQGRNMLLAESRRCDKLVSGAIGYPYHEQTARRAALARAAREANEWAHLAKKYALTSGTSDHSSSIMQQGLHNDGQVIREQQQQQQQQRSRAPSKLSAPNDNTTSASSAPQQQQVEGSKQMASRSSIGSTTGSSSSSSGCADNDYFISQSSQSSQSSMSSSSSTTTRSNEEELLFSQPASSSGIVGCSNGNTSDECDSSRKQQEGAAARQQAATAPTAELEGAKRAPSGRSERKIALTRRQMRVISRARCQNVKRIGVDSLDTDVDRLKREHVTCNHSTINCNDKIGDEIQCEQCAAATATADCLTLNSDEECDCCCDCLLGENNACNEDDEYCDCGLVERTETSLRRTTSDTHIVGSAKFHHQKDDELIYDYLPRFGNGTSSANKTTTTTRKWQPAPLSEENDENDDVGLRRYEKQNTTTPTSEVPDHQSKSKQKRRWLDGRKYMKMWPKFMFASSSGTTSSSSTSSRTSGRHLSNANLMINNNSGTLNRDSIGARASESIEFRRTRSSQNLST